VIKALLVEDEPLVRRGIRSMMPFGQFGMELVGEASSGEEALEALGRGEVDLLFTDISMPGMDGLEFIGIVREKYPHIRCVVLTCHQEFDFLQRALRLGAIDYIVKTQLDDDSVVELLQRVSAQFEQSSEKRDGQASGQEASADQADLEQGWRSLGWLLDHTALEEMLAESVKSLQAAEWKQLLGRALDNWLIKCPVLETLRTKEAGLAAADTINALKEWVRQFRHEALSLLRNTMYSEEVIHAILRSVDLLNKHAGEKINQADICKEINMSISYFSKCFKEIVGISFVAYAQDMNIRLAQHLLQTTNHPIYQIAEQSGFQDEKYFGKIFRQKSGKSPSEYRMQYRGNGI